MGTYRHIEHAGNFADVFKHILLCGLLESLKSPFYYFETHAGCGIYDLHSVDANRKKAYQSGITKIWSGCNVIPQVNSYFKIIQNSNNVLEKLRYYPGSPLFALHFLTTKDQAIICEFVRTEFCKLNQLMDCSTSIKILHTNGFLALSHLRELTDHQGLVFIDPPFMDASEVDSMIHAVTAAYELNSKGLIAAWYPLQLGARIKACLSSQLAFEALCLEFTLGNTETESNMQGCGMLITNPPTELLASYPVVCTWLLRHLAAPGHGSFNYYRIGASQK